MRTLVVYNIKTAVSVVIPGLIDAEWPRLVCKGLYLQPNTCNIFILCYSFPSAQVLKLALNIKNSQVRKKKCTFKLPFPLHYWSVLCVSAQKGMCWYRDSSWTPPAGTYHIQSHLASTWDLAFLWTFSLKVYFTWPLSHAWVGTHVVVPCLLTESESGASPSCQGLQVAASLMASGAGASWSKLLTGPGA